MYEKQLRKTVLMQANQISEMDSVVSNHTTMYVGLVKLCRLMDSVVSNHTTM